MPLEMTTRIARSTELLNSPIGDEIVFLNLGKNNYVALDEIGRRIWELLETPHRVDELCSELSREFDASPEQIAADVLPFLEELGDEDLVQVVDA